VRRCASTAAALVLALAASPPAHACDALQIVSETSETPLPDAWARELDALVAATAREGRPWSCPGGRASLILDPAGERATLIVEDRAARRRTRNVASPEDVVPMGEALLAVAEAPSASLPVEPSPTSTAQADSRAPPMGTHLGSDMAAPSRDPRFLVRGAVASRYVGATNALWGGAVVRGIISFGPWSVGIWTRYDLPAKPFSTVPPNFSMSEVCVGASMGRRLVSGPLEIGVAIDPSVAVVSMSGGQGGENAEGGMVDARLGLRVHAALPFGDTWRGIFELDGELAPAALGGSKRRRIDEALPPAPSYTAGLGVGLEAAIR